MIQKITLSIALAFIILLYSSCNSKVQREKRINLIRAGINIGLSKDSGLSCEERIETLQRISKVAESNSHEGYFSNTFRNLLPYIQFLTYFLKQDHKSVIKKYREYVSLEVDEDAEMFIGGIENYLPLYLNSLIINGDPADLPEIVSIINQYPIFNEDKLVSNYSFLLGNTNCGEQTIEKNIKQITEFFRLHMDH